MSVLAVVDTNVVVAGLLTIDATSPTVRILDLMLSGSLRFLLSIELLTEYREVLLRPKIARGHGLSADEVDRVLAALVLQAALREIAPPAAGLSPRGDEHVVALLAVDPSAVLVTGDRALASLVAERALSPGQFLALRIDSR
jgi:putative PIN family toxin of toxin-antitoxin system